MTLTFELDLEGVKLRKPGHL